jgi:hypothetical protein
VRSCRGRPHVGIIQVVDFAIKYPEQPVNWLAGELATAVHARQAITSPGGRRDCVERGASCGDSPSGANVDIPEVQRLIRRKRGLLLECKRTDYPLQRRVDRDVAFSNCLPPILNRRPRRF